MKQRAEDAVKARLEREREDNEIFAPSIERRNTAHLSEPFVPLNEQREQRVLRLCGCINIITIQAYVERVHSHSTDANSMNRQCQRMVTIISGSPRIGKTSTIGMRCEEAQMEKTAISDNCTLPNCTQNTHRAV
jgi:hypothetical protein